MSKNILVFCSASDNVLEEYRKLAYDFGKSIAKSGNVLVTGGGEHGLMGEVVKGCKEHNGKAIGITTSHLVGKETESDLFYDIVTDSMSERKVKMFEISDVVVALPGGFGTMDELFEAMTDRQIGESTLPIYMLDLKNRKYCTLMRDFINGLIDLGVLTKYDRNIITYCDNITEIMTYIRKNLCVPYVSKFPTKRRD